MAGGVNIPIRATDKTGPPTRSASNNFHTMQRRITASVARTVKALGAFSSVALAGAGAGAVFFSKSVFQATARLESMRIALAAASGDNRIAAADFTFLQTQADRLGLSLEAMVSTYGKYVAAAQGAGLTSVEVRDSFLAVSEAAAVMGLSSESTRLTLKALEQMLSKGRVQSEELRGQLGEHLPNAFQLAAKAMGMTTEAFSKALEQGQVLGRDLVPKLAQQIKAEWGDQVPKAMTRLQAGVERFSNEWLLLQDRIGQGGMAQAISNSANDMARLFRTARTQWIGPLERGVLSIKAAFQLLGAGAASGMQLVWGSIKIGVRGAIDSVTRSFIVLGADILAEIEVMRHGFNRLGNWITAVWNEAMASLREGFAGFAGWLAEKFDAIGATAISRRLLAAADGASDAVLIAQQQADAAVEAEAGRHAARMQKIMGDMRESLAGQGPVFDAGTAFESLVNSQAQQMADAMALINDEFATGVFLSNAFEETERMDAMMSKFIDTLSAAKDPLVAFQTILAGLESQIVGGQMSDALAAQIMALQDAMDAVMQRRTGGGGEQGADPVVEAERRRQAELALVLHEGVREQLRIKAIIAEWDEQQARERVQTEKEVQATIVGLNQTAASNLQEIQTYLAGKSKDWARVMVLINKGVAFVNAYVNTQEAITKANAIDPTGGLALKVSAAGKLAMAAIAGAAVANFAAINEGGGGGGALSSPGGSLNPINTRSEPAAEVQPQTSVYFTGPVIADDARTRDWIVDLLRRAGRNGAIIFENNSDQALLLQRG